MKVGVLTGGGDCPGLNAVIRAVARRSFEGGWEVIGLKTAVHVDGTPNDPRDTDKGWTVEIRWPWAGLKELTGVPVPPRDSRRHARQRRRLNKLSSVHRNIWHSPRRERKGIIEAMSETILSTS